MAVPQVGELGGRPGQRIAEHHIEQVAGGGQPPKSSSAIMFAASVVAVDEIVVRPANQC